MLSEPLPADQGVELYNSCSQVLGLNLYSFIDIKAMIL